MGKKSINEKEKNLVYDVIKDSEEKHKYLSYTLDDLKVEKNINKDKTKLEYIDFEMYKFIF
jgi:hypothetical protein